MRFGVRSLRTGMVRLSVVAGMVLISSPAFAGLVIVPTFTSNFNTNFGANAGAAQAAWIAAANVFESAFTDNIQINITVDAVAGTGTFGSSKSSFIFGQTWAQLQADALADAKTANDAIATGPGGSLSGADPTGGAEFWVTRSEAKALGIIPSDAANDGITTFGTGFNFTFSGPIAAGTYDFQGLAAHEISEVMGRIGLKGAIISGHANSQSMLDAFSYTGAGTRALGLAPSGSVGSFSINGGTTLLKLYNDAASNGLDTRDWAGGTNDSFNQFSSSDVVNGVSSVDLQELDVIGYDLAAPEPSTLMLLGSALVVAGLIRRRGIGRS